MESIKKVCDALCRIRYRNIAIFFFFIQIVVIARNLLDNYTTYLWFCDFAPFVFGLLFLFKKDDAVKGFLNIGLIPQIIFVFGIFYKLLFDVSLLGGVTDSFPLTTFYVTSTTLIHLSSLVALIITARIKPSKKTLVYSALFLTFIYIITLVFTSPQGVINYVYSPGDLINFSIPYYTYLWIPLTFIIVVLPTQLIQYLLWKSYKNKLL